MHSRQEFIAFSIASGVLRFGSFVTKSGRTTPYFFDAGLFNTGARLGRLAEFYAAVINGAGIAYDMLFGPAYKGIVLAAATAVALGQEGRDVPYAFQQYRKSSGILLCESLPSRRSTTCWMTFETRPSMRTSCGRLPRITNNMGLLMLNVASFISCSARSRSPAPATAQVYKYVDPSGKVVYTDKIPTDVAGGRTSNWAVRVPR